MAAQLNHHRVKSPSLLLVLLMCSAVPCLGAEGAVAARASPQLAAAISTGLPRFDQVAPQAPKREEAVDQIAMPPFLVQGYRIPQLSEYDFLNKDGMETYLLKLYPGASNRGQEPTQNGRVPNYAVLMYEDDLRLRRMADFEQVVGAMAKTGDSIEAKKLKAMLEGIFLRKHDFRTEGMDKSVNHWRR